MTNPFYNHTSGVPIAQSRGISSSVKAEFDLIQAGFDQVNTTATATAVLALLAASSGAALVGSIQSGTGATSRTVQVKLRDWVSVKDFGAVGDGVTDDTVAVQAAMTSCQTLRRGLYFPAGTYLVDTLQLPLTAVNQFNMFGESSTNTVLQKKTSNGLNLVIVGATSATAYTANLAISNLTFSGIAGNTAAALVAYDVVRSTFSGCIFQNALIGFNSLGGISNTFEDCTFQANGIGINFDKFTSLAGGGYPNNNDLIHCLIINNTLQGLKFNNGRSLNLICCDIEGNGTSGNSATMGIYVNNVNNESGGAAPAVGVTIDNCWIESNAGDAALQFNSGVNTVRSCYIAANTNATYDIHVNGGNYHLSEVAFGTNKANNLKEESGSSTGNSINNCFDALVGTLTFDAAKTLVQGAYNSGSGTLIPTLQMRSGSVPVAMGLTNPMIQTGNAITGALGVVSVTFSTAFSAAPKITAVVVDNTAGALDGVQVYSVTASGFTVRATQVVSGSSTVNNLVGYGVNWIAIGPTA